MTLNVTNIGAGGDQFVTLAFVGRMYGLQTASLRNMARAGVLPGATKCGTVWRVHLPTLKAAWSPAARTHGGAQVVGPDPTKYPAKESTCPPKPCP